MAPRVLTLPDMTLESALGDRFAEIELPPWRLDHQQLLLVMYKGAVLVKTEEKFRIVLGRPLSCLVDTTPATVELTDLP